MPDWKCPRCNATLREDDTDTWALPFDPAWDKTRMNAVQFSCWRCSWSVIWCAREVTSEVELPA